jgi:hypothetical protein
MLIASICLAILALIALFLWWRADSSPAIEDAPTTIIDDMMLARFAQCGSGYGELDEARE